MNQGHRDAASDGDQDAFILPAGFRALVRGDALGNILAASNSFQQLLGTDWGHLVGQPQAFWLSLQMPKGGTDLLQAGLRNDRFLFSYIKGRTFAGRPFWGAIFFMPLQDGAVTMITHPSSPLFAAIQSLDAQNANLNDQDKEAAFLQGLARLGFKSNEDMMWHAIWAEFQPEMAARSSHTQAFFSAAERLRNSLTQLQALQAELLETVAMLRDLPTNMRIIAARLEPSGGPLSAMSDIYSAASTALFTEVVAFSTGATSLTGALTHAFGKACAMKICTILQQDIAQDVQNDPPRAAGFSLPDLFDALDRLNATCQNLEHIALSDAQKLAQKINAASYDLRRSVLGLDTVRVMGLVESGRMRTKGSRIGATMEQIGDCHDRIVIVLQKIKDTATSLNRGVTELRNSVTRPSFAA